MIEKSSVRGRYRDRFIPRAIFSLAMGLQSMMLMNEKLHKASVSRIP